MSRSTDTQTHAPTSLPRPARPIRLYRFALSGHCHRIELMLNLLDLPYEAVDIDLGAGEHRKPAYLAINPFGQVPAIDDDGVVLADSNAILVYLATRYDDPLGERAWLPRDPVAAAHVQRWLSVAAGDLAFGAAAARIAVVFQRGLGTSEMMERGTLLLTRLEAHLTGSNATPFVAAATPTIADIALYSYLAHAPEGNISLQQYPAVRTWLARIEALPRFVPMPPSACGLNAVAA